MHLYNRTDKNWNKKQKRRNKKFIALLFNFFQNLKLMKKYGRHHFQKMEKMKWKKIKYF